MHGNADQLIQVLLNIVKNACEAVPAINGRIVLRTAYQHGVRLALPGGATRVQLPLLVTVTDNGPGILPDLAANLFDPFVTSKPDGSGLGMALAAKVVGDHGGVIEFDHPVREPSSALGCLCFRTANPPGLVGHEQSVDYSIADDDRAIRTVLERALVREGYDVKLLGECTDPMVLGGRRRGGPGDH